VAGLGPRARRCLWALLVGGLVVRLVMAFATYGVRFDVDAFLLVHNALHADPLHVYGVERWPYPPGYFPWIVISSKLQILTGVPLTDWVQVPAILADIAIAWIVQSVLGRRGHPSAERLLACGLVALGPIFVMISGFHGQIDSVAILPALLAVLVWERYRGPRRGLYAGLLIGVGGLIKTVPLVAVLALLPSARSRREGVTALAAALVPVALSFVPFAVVDFAHVQEALRYRGVPGVGGISLLVQPELANFWISNAPFAVPNGASSLLSDAGGAITAVALGAAIVFLFRRRPEPVVGIALLYMVVWAFGVNFFLQYLVWGIPFLLMAGYVREVAAAQLLILPAVVLAYGRPWSLGLAPGLFVVVSLGLWASAAAGLVILGRAPYVRAPGPRAAPSVHAG